jgi:DNA mismatch repair protein MutL
MCLRKKFPEGRCRVEMRHIIDEFQRIAMANPDIHFTMHQNDTEIFHLPSGNLRQRVVKVFGDAVNEKTAYQYRRKPILSRLQVLSENPTTTRKTEANSSFLSINAT